jgi:hypothetical protein
MTSRDALEIESIPKSITIIGGGVIGMEFAFIFNALGSEVHVVEYAPEILMLLDQDVVDVIKESAEEKGIKIHSFKAINGQMTQTHFQEKYASHEWNFGACTSFDIMVEEKFQWGLLNLEMNIDGGNIKTIHLRTDALDYQVFSQLNKSLREIKLTEENLENVLYSTCKDLRIQKDLQKLFRQHLFN